MYHFMHDFWFEDNWDHEAGKDFLKNVRENG